MDWSVSLGPDAAPAAATPDADAALQALAEVLWPLARLAVAKGLPYAAVEQVLKQAFVRAASDAHPDLLPHRRVSRIAIATGLNRREVTRLTQTDSAPPPRPSHAAEVFARWIGDPAYRDRRGQPRALPRQGEAPSFESLAQSVTRDVHPRSLLDELLRLGLAELDAAHDQVRLLREAFVPRGDSERMLAFLGRNVGDHAGAAVANVLGDGRQHFDQAVYADALSRESVDALRELISAQWHALAAALVPRLQALVADDRDAARAATQRVRVGLYSFSEPLAGTAVDAATDPAPRGDASVEPVAARRARTASSPRTARVADPAVPSHPSTTKRGRR